MHRQPSLLPSLLFTHLFIIIIMENFINASKNYLNSQGGQGGGDQDQPQSGSGGGGFNIGDIAGIVNHAQNHDQSNSGDQQLFGQVASFLQAKSSNVQGDVNENELMNSHQKVNNGTDPVNSHEIGNAAALGAIRNVLGSGSGDANQGDFQQKLIGAAMAQAGKLFDQKQSAGQASGGSKEDAMNKAGEQVMKLLIKNKVSGMIGGGNSGGLSGLMNLIG